ncbi:MAG TPA: GerMN domain-containing protein, partial [Phycisphaerae bacterium]|nr:GerMN domain-containing protein [Phycisphaerae bacterium]
MRSSLFCLLGFLLVDASLMAAEIRVCLRTDNRLQWVRRQVADDADRIEAALTALVAGPTDAERAAGLTSALPPGTTVTGILLEGDTITVDFSPELLAGGVGDAWLEAVFEQVRWTLDPLIELRAIRLTVAGMSLSDYLPPVPQIPPVDKKGLLAEPPPLITAAGSALAGKKIALSPGHGLRWGGSSWNYERPVYCAPLNNEDLHNLELMIYLDAYLRQDGATTKSYRCLDKSFGDYAPGKPWWTMSAAYWLKHIGYPCSVYASSTGDCTLGSGASEDSDSLRSRPLASNYDNTDIYISMHTNGLAGDCTGSGCPNGTCTYYDNGTVHRQWGAISQALAQQVNTEIVNVIRTHYSDATWRNRGALDADGSYAETRLPTRAAILIELAFHDTCDRDALYLQD